MQRGKEGLANGSRVVFFFCFFFFCLFLVPLLHFYFIEIPFLPAPAPPPQPATSNNTAKLHWIPTLLLSFLIFVRKHKRARIFDTTYFYMSYSCKNEMTQNIRLIILEGLLCFVCVQVQRIESRRH